MGQLEELLKDRTQKIRYLIPTNFKIIYWIKIEKSQIKIVDDFD